MKHRLTRYVVITMMLLFGSCVSAFEISDLKQSYLFFPFAHAEIRPNISDDQNLEAFETEIGSDFFYLLNYKKFRALAELAFTSQEIELERLQLGLDISNNETLWLGRFHTPLGYWNSTYHHGLHLQTSVHRPGIIEYEDDGGILPNHVTGILLNGQRDTNIGVIKYSTAIGFAPTLKKSLEPYMPGSTNNKLHSIIKIGYQADETNPSESGIVFSQSIIKTENAQLDYIKQNLFGLYSHQSWKNARITASSYLIQNDLFNRANEDTSAKFAAGYVHLEYDAAAKLITYFRLERALGTKNDPYLTLFDHYETGRNLAGIRYELTRRQAFSSEISKRINPHNTHTHISLQWSAVFP